MNAVVQSLLALATAVGLAASALAKDPPDCKDPPDRSEKECVIRAKPNKGPMPCSPKLTLSEKFKEVGLRSNIPYSKAFTAARALSDHPGLSFRVIFRPADEDGMLLSMNPHSRADVEVCNSHEVELYVGRVPYWTMPSASLTAMSVASATEAVVALGGLKPDVWWDGAHAPDDPGRVVAQSPPASAGYGRRGIVSRFAMPEQRPVLLVKSATGAGKERPVETAVKCIPGSVETEFVERITVENGGEDARTVLVGAGSFGAGLALARLLGGSGHSSPPGSPAGPSIRGTTPLPKTRVRPDARPSPTPGP